MQISLSMTAPREGKSDRVAFICGVNKMGCGGSTNGEKSHSPNGEAGSALRKQPKVSIKVGNSAKILDSKLKIVFVFGGPGTKKGKLLDNLSNVFGFEVINVEGIILEELTRKLEDPDPSRTIPAIQQMLKTNQDHMKLDAVLRMLAKRLENVNPNKFCIIDFMPNLKWMLGNTSFIKECTNELALFEERFPVSFVIHFVMPKDKVLNKIESEHHKVPQGDQTLKQDSNKQTDEVDSSRTQKRVLLFENSIKHFIEYFSSREKVVTMDVSCGYQEAIWAKVCQFFTELQFQSRSTPETVIVFGFDQDELTEINIGLYGLTVITLRDVAFDPNAPVETLLEQICHYVDKCEPSRRVFAVDGTGTSLTTHLEKKKTKKAIQFIEKGDQCRLGRYCSVNLSIHNDPVELQAVASSENEVCLFSPKVPTELCKWIGITMADQRQRR